MRYVREYSMHFATLGEASRCSVTHKRVFNPRTALHGPTVGTPFLRVEAIGLPSICLPRSVGPGGRRGAKERITI